MPARAMGWCGLQAKQIGALTTCGEHTAVGQVAPGPRQPDDPPPPQNAKVYDGKYVTGVRPIELYKTQKFS